MSGDKWAVGLAAAVALVASTQRCSHGAVLDQDFAPDLVNGGGFVSRTGSIWYDHGQTFQVGTTGTLAGVDVFISELNGFTGDLSVDIRRTSGGVPLGGSSSVLGSVTIPSGTAPLGYHGWVNADFSPLDIPVSAGDVLAMTLSTPDDWTTYSWLGTFSGLGLEEYSRGRGFERSFVESDWHFYEREVASDGQLHEGDFMFRTYVDAPPPPPDRVRVISGVPCYDQRMEPDPNCGPTSAGMMLGYWDGHGYPNIVSGSAATQTPSVDNMIWALEHGMGESQTLMPVATSLYLQARGYGSHFLISGWTDRTAEMVKGFIDHNCPGIIFQDVGGFFDEGHFYVVVGYKESFDSQSQEYELTDVYLIDPRPSEDPDIKRSPFAWTESSLQDVLFLWPKAVPAAFAMEIVLCGDFDSPNALTAFALDVTNGPGQAEVSLLPDSQEEYGLAMTTDGGQVTISQDMMLAFGQGFTLSFDYSLPDDGKLEVFLDSSRLFTLDDPTAGMTNYSSYFKTHNSALDPLGLHELSFSFSASDDPTAYLDGLSVVIHPVPEPSTLAIWSLLGALGLTVGWWRRKRAA